MSPDKLVLARTTAQNFEATNAGWNMCRVVRHFQSRGSGTFLIGALMMVTVAFFFLLQAGKCTP